MRNVGIVGIGQVPVAEHWDRSLRDLSTDAVISALHDAGDPIPGALYVGNMLSGELTGQENVATLIAVSLALVLASIPAKGEWTVANMGTGGLILWPMFLSLLLFLQFPEPYFRFFVNFPLTEDNQQ